MNVTKTTICGFKAIEKFLLNVVETTGVLVFSTANDVKTVWETYPFHPRESFNRVILFMHHDVAASWQMLIFMINPQVHHRRDANLSSESVFDQIEDGSTQKEDQQQRGDELQIQGGRPDGPSWESAIRSVAFTSPVGYHSIAAATTTTTGSGQGRYFDAKIASNIFNHWNYSTKLFFRKLSKVCYISPCPRVNSVAIGDSDTCSSVSFFEPFSHVNQTQFNTITLPTIPWRIQAWNRS